MKALKRFLFLAFVVLASSIAAVVLLGQLPDPVGTVNRAMGLFLMSELALALLFLIAGFVLVAVRR